MKLHPSEQNSVTDIFKSKCPPDVILEVKVQKMFIFNDSHNFKTRIQRENNGQAKSWDLEVVFTWNFQKLTDQCIF